MKIDRTLAVAACTGGALAVVGGAFAAHGAAPAVRALLQTGAQYLMAHALLALVCAAWPRPDRMIRVGGWLAIGGGLVFMAALGAIGLRGLRVMGAIAPVGGLAMIAAWLVIGLAAWRAPLQKA